MAEGRIAQEIEPRQTVSLVGAKLAVEGRSWCHRYQAAATAQTVPKLDQSLGVRGPCEIHSGFATLRASLPVNLKGYFPGFKIWTRAQADIDRVCTIWRECLEKSGGPYLFGAQRTMADAMYAPVVTRFKTYDVKLPAQLTAYADVVMSMPEMQQWTAAAKAEPEEIEELEVEY